MNRIEQRMQELSAKGEKAFITYQTAGLPDMGRCVEVMKAIEEAGVDVIELGVPFSDPIADGPVIQDASFRSIQKGTTLVSTFEAVEKARGEGLNVPIIFMLYYNTVMYYGVEKFVERCREVGVDGIIIPDLPLEEQGEIKGYLEGADSPIMIELVSPVSAERIPKIVKGAKGFIYCVSAMGVTGQSGSFYGTINQYLQDVKDAADIPVMMGFGIRTAEDIAPMKGIIDGAIVGSHFINIMEESAYDVNVARDYVSTFKKEMNA
ncbi:MAG: tryptophan synthase subunit alpha [Eubacterium sp.]|nr:tryptophan synthase subunit alpha [Eubacterium sp.]